jgi:hypothetical protein
MANTACVVGFRADFGVPKGINDGAPGALWPPVALDLGLIWLFGLHHSATARRWFKERWTRIVPPALERATYLCMTALATALLVTFWTSRDGAGASGGFTADVPSPTMAAGVIFVLAGGQGDVTLQPPSCFVARHG